MKIKLLRWVFLAPLLATFLNAPSKAGEVSIVKAELEGTGALVGAAGKITVAIKDAKSRIRVTLSGLTPDATHTFVVDGITEAEFETSGSGRAKLSFSTDPGPKDSVLDFDIRGKDVAVKEDGDDILTGVISGEGEDEDASVVERAEVLGSNNATKLDLFFKRKGASQRFKIAAKKLPEADYELFIGGKFRGLLSTSSKGSGKLEFDTLPRGTRVLLGFDPRYEPIDLCSNGVVILSGRLEADAVGITRCDYFDQTMDLISTGADTNATGEVRWRIRETCRQDFSVEVEDLPDGNYTLCIAGNDEGTIVVSGDEGEIEFTTAPGENDRLLSFDPRGATVQVKQGTNVFFSGVAQPTSSPARSCQELETEVSLINTRIFNDLVPDATGEMEFEVEEDCNITFTVSVEGLWVGNYNVKVAGTTEGVLTVVRDGDDLEGELEFNFSPSGLNEALLDFDPRGQTIQIESGGNVYLERMFPR